MHRFPALSTLLVACALAIGTPAMAAAQQGRAAPGTQSAADSVAVTATVERFHRALATADSAGALALLTTDVQVLESGGVETRAEYRSHHLASDIAFARAVTSQRTVRQVRVRGDVAWISSTSTGRGTYRMREVNATGAELMVLERTPAGWRIAAIHWSNR